MPEFMTAENIAGVGGILSVLGIPVFWFSSWTAVRWIVCAIWAATGTWCLYLLYCLWQIAKMYGG